MLLLYERGMACSCKKEERKKVKAYKTLLFIFSVIAVLAVACVMFPHEGVKAGNVTLTFPSLGEVLMSTATEKAALPEETPEELLARQLREMRMQEEAQYLDYFRTSNIRINLPNDDLTFFDPLFEALENADSTRMRIVHYGDSQIEGDRITGIIREELQDTFGGIGPGILPLIQTVGSINIGQSITDSVSRGLVYGPAEMRGRNSSYGVMGQVAYLDTTVSISVWPRTKESKHCTRFTRVTVLSENTSSNLYITCKGDRRVLEPAVGQRQTTFHFADPVERVSLSLSGYANIYGILLDGDTGVCVDNIPMRGCSGTMFSNINRGLLSDFYRRENVRLIIMQYGGNSVPYLKTEKSISTYAGQMEHQIRYLQECAPDAKIMMIGPSDMSTMVKGSWQTYPMLPAVIDSLRMAANRAGAAYWDMYQVMGGHNSMAQWCSEQPPLAGSDHIHFTQRGATRVADLFCKSIMLYYDYYLWRRGDKSSVHTENVKAIPGMQPILPNPVESIR